MTEVEWLTSHDPVALMCGLSGHNVSHRKQELFNCAVARAVCDSWPEPACEKYIELVERNIEDQPVSDTEWDQATDEMGELAWSSCDRAKKSFDEFGHWTPSALALLHRYVSISTANTPLGSMQWWHWLCDLEYTKSPTTFDEGVDSMLIDSYRACLPLLRCIVGNPFRPVAFDPAWRSETAVALASAVYAERAFDRLPILGDALEEAGYDHPDVLGHCRGPGPHARGCWVVDGVLGKC